MQTLLDLLAEIRRLGTAEAVRCSNGLCTTIYSYRDLYGTIGAAVYDFERLGVSKGDRILVCAENGFGWVAVFWACVARGVCIIPVDFRFSPDLMEKIRHESGAKLVLNNEALEHIASLPRITSFEVESVKPDDIVEIVYTSGTTGEPKGVIHRHRNICANLRPFQSEINRYKKWAWPFQPIRVLDLLPLSHLFGQSQGLFIPLLLEGAVTFSSETHSGRLMKIIREEKISVVVCVPRILENLSNEVKRRFRPEIEENAKEIGVFRRWIRHRRVHSQFGWKFWAFVVGGARVDPDLESFWGRLGFLVIQGYGLTEASPVVAVNHPFNARKGSLGKVVPGQEVRIAADGEILVRGESVTTDGEWLHTGDFGEIDSEGRLYFRGRKKDVIITAEGLNVHPEDVEAVLNKLPEVLDSAVVGVRNGGGERVHAVLILSGSNSNPEEIIRSANLKLEQHQRIQAWSIWPDKDFPRTASTLKIKRGEVARQIQRPSARERDVGPDLSAMSSLERVELLSELENARQVELNEEEFSRLRSNLELEQWLETAQSSTTDRSAPPSHWARRWPINWLRDIFQYLVAIPIFRNYLLLTVSGLENLRGIEPPVIFAANHTSHLDTPAILAALPYHWRRRVVPAMSQDVFRAYFESPQRSLTKETLKTGMGYFLACALFNAYPLPQQMAGVRRALNYTADLVRQGFCPLVYPEGSRTTDGQMHEFRPGIGMMAVRLQATIVPVHLYGLYQIYSIHDEWPKSGPVHVSFGAPFRCSAATYEEAAKKIEAAVKTLEEKRGQ